MSLLVWYAVLGAVQVALALWVILAQPRRILNWAVGSLLMLSAGTGVMYQLWREAPAYADKLLGLRVGGVYHAPIFFLTLLVIDRLLLPTPKPRAWKGILIASGAAVPIFCVLQPDGLSWYTEIPSSVNASLEYLAQTAAVVMATRVASDATRSTLQRRQAAMVGLSFALLLVHAGASGLGNLFWGAPWGPYFVDGKITHSLVTKANFTLLGIVGLAVSLRGFMRMPTPFQAGGRAAMRASLLLTFLVGVVSYATIAGFTIVGGRAIVLSAFSLVIAVAVFRYDLAAAGIEARRRLQATSVWIMGLCVVSIVAVAAWSLLPQGAIVLAIALAAVVVPAALLITPIRRIPAWLTRRVLLNPRDPEALRERVRLYASTLRAATGRDGEVLPAAEPTLAALRSQLGLGQRDHDLLVAMGGDQAAGGIVAYRLAIVGAAAEAEVVDLDSLRDLREQLGLTERDHAMVLEHVRAGADNLAVGALFLGRYHVLRRLDDGGLAEVWLARDNRSQTEVVVKHLAPHEARDAAALKRIRQEVDNARLLEHPNIVAVRGVEAIGSETYLVMEHMAGGSLAQRLQREGKMAEPDVVRFATDIMSALVALHGRSIVHFDVKPGNIMFDAKGVAKLGDFNIARELISGVTLGNDGNRPVVGTFAYMPLDQARGMAPSPQHDLHALAATMYEALSGAPLLGLSGLSHAEAIGRIAARPAVIAVPNASPPLADLLSRALGRTGQPDSKTMLAELTRVGMPAGSGQRRLRHLA